MATLYELADAYQVLLEMAEDPETDPEFLADTLEGLEGEIEDKCDGCAVVMKELEGRAEMISKEIKRLEAWKKACEGNRDRIKARIQNVMEMSGKEKFETGRFKFRIQNNPETVVLDVPGWKEVPKDFLRYKDPDVDKAKLKAAIKAGTVPDGIAHLEQTRGLRIS